MAPPNVATVASFCIVEKLVVYVLQLRERVNDLHNASLVPEIIYTFPSGLYALANLERYSLLWLFFGKILSTETQRRNA